MKIEQIDPNRIKVVVDTGEQREYGVTYESMNYSDANTRKLCEKIMSLARTQVGFSVGNAKLLVEARQSCNGSVTLYLSRISQEKEKTELFGQMLVFRDVNALLDCRPLFDGYGAETDLFFYGDRYYLYFELQTTQPRAERLLGDLLEYGDRSSLDVSFLREHGSALGHLCRK